MASSRKKQDENNLKTLRELGALPQNKFCFDCGQRGPTYVNVTIGSFVCTKCSGILRGLTPPHRVKSISMATFTTEEIDTLRSKGNDYCRKLWLGLYEGMPPTFSGDEQQVRDFMIEKYERKRYYLERSMTKPEVPNTRPWSTTPTLNGTNLKMNNGTKNGLTKSLANNNVPNGTVPNGIITTGTSRSRPEVKNHNCINNNLGNSFAVDFDKADIFSNTSTSSTGSSQSPQQNGFADFEHNAVYNATSNASTNDDEFSIFDLEFSTINGPTMNQVPLFPRCTTNRWSMPSPSALNAWAAQQTSANPQNGRFNGVGGTGTSINSSTVPQIDDKYAALKDLDNEMKQQQHQDVWSTSNTGSTGSLYSSSTPTTGSVYGSPSPQGSIFGSPSQGQFMSAFAPLQENSTQIANPFGAAPVSNPWANTNGFTNGSHGFSNGTNTFTNSTPNGFTNSTPNGFANGVSNCVNGLNQQAFVNPFRDQVKTNGFSNIVQPSNGMSNGWGGNPFKVGTVAAMNTNNPFL